METSIELARLDISFDKPRQLSRFTRCNRRHMGGDFAGGDRLGDLDGTELYPRCKTSHGSDRITSMPCRAHSQLKARPAGQPLQPDHLDASTVNIEIALMLSTCGDRGHPALTTGCWWAYQVGTNRTSSHLDNTNDDLLSQTIKSAVLLCSAALEYAHIHSTTVGILARPAAKPAVVVRPLGDT